MGEKHDDKKQNEEQNKGDSGLGLTTVVLKFDMHCEGCAKKVNRSIKNFHGVDNVKTEFSTGKLTVVGKVDPIKIKERVEEKIKKKVELLSLQQNKVSNKEGGSGGGSGGGGRGGGGGEKKSGEKNSGEKSDNKKSEDKKEKEHSKEPPVATVLLKTRVHCDGCAQKIKKIVAKCDGVQDVNVDLQKDTITVKGTMNMKDLLPYLNIKLKRNVELASNKKVESPGGDKKPKEGGGGSGGGEKPKEGGGGSGGGGGKQKQAGGSSEKAKGGGEKKEDNSGENKDKGGSSGGVENVTKIEVNKMEYNPYGYGPYGYRVQAHTYDPRQYGDNYGHQVVEYWHEPDFSEPPQMFSDENPNACSVM